MKLEPVTTTTTPRYPARRSTLGRLKLWARRLGTAAGAAALLGAAGCYGASPFDEGSGDDAAPFDGGIVDDGGDGAVDDGGDGGIVDDGSVDDAAPDVVVPPDGGVVDRALAYCEPDYRLSGEAPGPVLDHVFVCGATMPADTPTLAVPDYFGDPWNIFTGALCGEETAWSQASVAEPARLRFSFPWGASHVQVRLLAPDGGEAAVLDQEVNCVELDAEAGAWILAATPSEENPAGDGDFSVALEPAPPEDWF